MATVNTNPIVHGLSGMLGKTIVFRTLRGKTIMSNRPARPKTQSEQQRTNRSKFRDASLWAKSVMRDPLKKEYYKQKARKLKLPNAYTAAITDYMRKPQVKESDRKADEVIYRVSKKDFALKSVAVRLCDINGAVIETRGVEKDSIQEWTIRLREADWQYNVFVDITDDARRLSRYPLIVIC